MHGCRSCDTESLGTVRTVQRASHPRGFRWRPRAVSGARSSGGGRVIKRVPPATGANPMRTGRALAGGAHRFGEGERWPAARAGNRRTLLVLKTVWGRQLPTTVGRDGPDGRGGRPRPAPMPPWAAGRVRAWAGPCPLHGAGRSGHRAALRLVRALGAGGGAVWRGVRVGRSRLCVEKACRETAARGWGADGLRLSGGAK